MSFPSSPISDVYMEPGSPGDVPMGAAATALLIKKALSRTVEWYYPQLLTEADITDPLLTVEDYREIFRQLQIPLNFELKFGNEGDDIIYCHISINGKSWRTFGRDAGRNNALADLCRVWYCKRKMQLDNLLDSEYFIRLKTTLNSHGASFVADRASSFSGLLSNILQSLQLYDKIREDRELIAYVLDTDFLCNSFNDSLLCANHFNFDLSFFEGSECCWLFVNILLYLQRRVNRRSNGHVSQAPSNSFRNFTTGNEVSKNRVKENQR
ncbi:hypothetical protein MP228_003180 [Amoeboaphelidium protococcarum]|nr:hypothetical protein MP228_003180 [Amoeboaphelidium protococcarum]